MPVDVGGARNPDAGGSSGGPALSAPGDRGGAAPSPAPPTRTPGNYVHRGWNHDGDRLPNAGAKPATGARQPTKGDRPTADRAPGEKSGGSAVRPIGGGVRTPAPGIGGGAPGVVSGGGGNGPEKPAAGPAARSSWAGGLYVGGAGYGANLNYTTGVGSSTAYLHAHHGHGYGYSPWYGCAPYSYDPFWSLPRWPSYGTWYGPASWSPWYSPYGAYCGYAYPASYGWAHFNGGYWSHRWSVGFGFNVCPTYGSHWYPTYRVYRYLPYYYYSTVSYYPAYSTVYVHDAPTSLYVDSGDPYVEYEDDVPTAFEAVAPAPVAETAARGPAPTKLAPVGPPDAFAAPLVAEYPSGLTVGAYVERANRDFASGRYWDAAEALRRAWAAEPTDAAHPLGVGYALVAAGRYDLAAQAFRAAYTTDPWAHRRAEDLRARFGSEADYRTARIALERRVFVEPSDVDARLSYAALLFASGEWFAARTEFAALSGREPAADVFRDEAARRLTTDGR